MNEQDEKLAEQAETYADRTTKGGVNWGQAFESKLIELIRADEREACAELFEPAVSETHRAYAAAIRDRGNK